MTEILRPTRRAIAAIATVAAALASAGPAAADEAPSAVRSYWTAERMLAADPIEEVAPAPASAADAPSPVIGGTPRWVPPATRGPSAPALRGPLPPLIARPVQDPAAGGVRMHGRVFFTALEDGERRDYSCSGTAINSRNARTVWTAGHCAFDRQGGGYMTNWTFVPGYQDGAAPFGEWPARRLLVTGRYRASEDLRFDFAAAAVARNASGQALQDVVGARGIAFNQPRDQHYTAFGYPISPPFFDGNRREFRCAGNERGGDRFVNSAPRPLAIECDMTGGASGGGWVAPGGVVLSVTSYGYPNDPFTLYGPYLGSAAKKVYEKVSRKPRPKRGGKGGKR